jgi:hypothetical protein
VTLKIEVSLLVCGLINEVPNEALFFCQSLEGNQFVQQHFPSVWMVFSCCKNTRSTETFGVKQ